MLILVNYGAMHKVCFAFQIVTVTCSLSVITRNAFLGTINVMDGQIVLMAVMSYMYTVLVSNYYLHVHVSTFPNHLGTYMYICMLSLLLRMYHTGVLLTPIS